ncbi:MAG: FecR domain-containing protein [Deltaproteobacteria bacterium]|jgi:ferric-dicitrate binding protein FerR (iron transport regulator)
MRHLARLAPRPDVHDRIVRGSLERIHARRRRRSGPLVLGLATAMAAAVVCWQLVPAPRVAAPVAVAPTIEEAPGSELTVERDDAVATELYLARGRASFEVPKRKHRSPFRVRTPSALVEVVGTGFTVQTEGLCTDVEVRHGMVRVEAEGYDAVLLTAGQSATRCLPEDASEGEAWISEAVPLVAAGEDLQRAAQLLERYRRTFPRGVLQEEALYYLAVCYARMNRVERGRVIARELVARQPGTARAQELTKWFEL